MSLFSSPPVASSLWSNYSNREFFFQLIGGQSIRWKADAVKGGNYYAWPRLLTDYLTDQYRWRRVWRDIINNEWWRQGILWSGPSAHSFIFLSFFLTWHWYVGIYGTFCIVGPGTQMWRCLYLIPVDPDFVLSPGYNMPMSHQSRRSRRSTTASSQYKTASPSKVLPVPMSPVFKPKKTPHDAAPMEDTFTTRDDPSSSFCNGNSQQRLPLTLSIDMILESMFHAPNHVISVLT